MERLRQGDPEAGDLLVDRFGGPLIRFFQSVNPGDETAEDLANETLLRFIRAVRAPIPPTVRNVPAFLFTIARNLHADQMKRASRRPATVPLRSLADTGPEEHAVDPIDPAPDPREAAARAQERRLLREAIEELEPTTREIVLLRHVEGVTCPEIARMVGITEGTVWSRLHRGLQAVRKRLTPQPISKQRQPEKSTTPRTERIS